MAVKLSELLTEMSMNKFLAAVASLLVLTGCGPSAPSATERKEAHLRLVEQRIESERLELEALAMKLGAEVAPPALNGFGTLAVLNAQEFIQANSGKAFLIKAAFKEVYQTQDGYRMIFEPALAIFARTPNLLVYDVGMDRQLLDQIRNEPEMLRTFPTPRAIQIVAKLHKTSLLPIEVVQGNQDSASVARRLVITGELISIIKK